LRGFAIVLLDLRMLFFVLLLLLLLLHLLVRLLLLFLIGGRLLQLLVFLFLLLDQRHWGKDHGLHRLSHRGNGNVSHVLLLLVVVCLRGGGGGGGVEKGRGSEENEPSLFSLPGLAWLQKGTLRQAGISTRE